MTFNPRTPFPFAKRPKETQRTKDKLVSGRERIGFKAQVTRRANKNGVTLPKLSFKNEEGA